jgi:hypothetical protein
MLQLEEKFQNMDIGVQIFFNKIEVLQKKGLPGMLVLNDKLMTLSDYKQKIITVAKDSSKFSGIQGSITGKAFLETLQLTSVFNMKSNIFSSPSQIFPSIPRWTKSTADY